MHACVLLTMDTILEVANFSMSVPVQLQQLMLLPITSIVVFVIKSVRQLSCVDGNLHAHAHNFGHAILSISTVCRLLLGVIRHSQTT